MIDDSIRIVIERDGKSFRWAIEDRYAMSGYGRIATGDARTLSDAYVNATAAALSATHELTTEGR